MNIAVIGTGYVGLVTGVCLAHIGNNVTCIDVDEEKIEKLRRGKSPIYEEGLEDLLKKNIRNHNLNFTSSYEEGLLNREIVYIAIGTPQGDDGSADLKGLMAACKDIGENLYQDAIIVTKSTVPIGTNEYIAEIINQHLSRNISVKLVSNPEFLRQGSAVQDTFHGSRIVIGSDDEDAMEVIENINKPFHLPIVKTDLRSAEMIKYASNAFLATKISFINEIANLCEGLDADIESVRRGIGLDPRIGGDFLKAGIGYGGSCFPKDISAIISIGESTGYSAPLLKSVRFVNETQWKRLVDRIKKRFGSLEDKTIALLGLSFKPNTDDLRGAPSIFVSEELLNTGARINAYDPVAIHNAKKILSQDIYYFNTIEGALRYANFAVILTDWQEIKEYDITHFKEYLTEPIIFDGRNCLPYEKLKGSGLEYHSVGRQVINR